MRNKKKPLESIYENLEDQDSERETYKNTNQAEVFTYFNNIEVEDNTFSEEITEQDVIEEVEESCLKLDKITQSLETLSDETKVPVHSRIQSLSKISEKESIYSVTQSVRSSISDIEEDFIAINYQFEESKLETFIQNQNSNKQSAKKLMGKKETDEYIETAINEMHKYTQIQIEENLEL